MALKLSTEWHSLMLAYGLPNEQRCLEESSETMLNVDGKRLNFCQKLLRMQ